LQYQNIGAGKQARMPLKRARLSVDTRLILSLTPIAHPLCRSSIEASDESVSVDGSYSGLAVELDKNGEFLAYNSQLFCPTFGRELGLLIRVAQQTVSQLSPIHALGAMPKHTQVPRRKPNLQEGKALSSN
jgi:hypothetical protein